MRYEGDPRKSLADPKVFVISWDPLPEGARSRSRPTLPLEKKSVIPMIPRVPLRKILSQTCFR